jgi:hypothetical protein
MSQSIAALPDKFLTQAGTECEVMARSRHWSILRQDRNGSVRFSVWPVRILDHQEVAVDLKLNEVYGYSFQDFDDAVNLLAKLLTHSDTVSA